jgi:hypothetical protein
MIDCRALSPGKRIQYICKQGGQTFLIESSALLDRLRAAGSFLPIGITEIRMNYRNTQELQKSSGITEIRRNYRNP